MHLNPETPKMVPSEPDRPMIPEGPRPVAMGQSNCGFTVASRPRRFWSLEPPSPDEVLSWVLTYGNRQDYNAFQMEVTYYKGYEDAIARAWRIINLLSIALAVTGLVAIAAGVALWFR